MKRGLISFAKRLFSAAIVWFVLTGIFVFLDEKYFFSENQDFIAAVFVLIPITCAFVILLNPLKIFRKNRRIRYGLIDYIDPLGERNHVSDQKVNSLYQEAVDTVIKTNNASASILQRNLNISFNNARALIDRMEKEGIVGPFLGDRPRQIFAEENKRKIEYQKQKVQIEPETKIDIYRITQDENEWRRQQRGLSPIEYELEQIDSMEGHQFEYWCADLLRKIGFIDVEVTQGSGDQGVDIIAKKDGIKYAIQCKCYSSDLGNKPVQEVNTGKTIYHCQIGAVITNRHFTQGGQEAAEATSVLLWDRDWIQ